MKALSSEDLPNSRSTSKPKCSFSIVFLKSTIQKRNIIYILLDIIIQSTDQDHRCMFTRWSSTKFPEFLQSKELKAIGECHFSTDLWDLLTAEFMWTQLALRFARITLRLALQRLD